MFAGLFLLINICPDVIVHVRCEQHYIVTSRESTCPGELMGEPCLTLQQYVLTPVYDNGNTELVLESGKHELSKMSNSPAYLAESYTGNFTLISDNAMVRIGQYLSVHIRGVPMVHISSTTFAGFGTLSIYGAEVIHIEECTFLGIALSLNYNNYYPNVATVLTNITKSHFSGFGTVTLRIYDVEVIHIEECTFLGIALSLNNNYYHPNVAIVLTNITKSHFSGFGTLRIYDAEVIHIEECTFLGTALSLNNYYYPDVAAVLTNIIKSHFSDCDSDSSTSYSGAGRSSLILSHSNDVAISYCTFSNSGGINIRRSVNTLSISHNNFSDNAGRAIYIAVDGHTRGQSLLISMCIFVNNKIGGAVYIERGFHTITVNMSTFVGNRVIGKGGYGGAIYFSHPNYVIITESYFISNSASHGGALSIIVNNPLSQFYIINSVFDSNNALDSGGVAFINKNHVFISDCTFTNNMATRGGGVIHADGSTLNVNNSFFKNNKAGTDGGVLYTYALSTNYSITQCVFMSNEAGDDGGAIFVGQKESRLIVNGCGFRNNHAADRGGAITIFGSLLTTTMTNIYGNRAYTGNSISACYSSISTTIPPEIEDLTNTFCAEYDEDSIDYRVNEPQELSYPNSILQHLESKGSCSDSYSRYSSIGVLDKASMIVYSSLSISITLAIILSVYATVKMAIKCYKKVKSRRSDLQQTTVSIQNQGTCRPDDSVNTSTATNLVCETSKDVMTTPSCVYNNTEDIEMIPNSVYGHTTSTTTHTQ